MAFDIRHGDYVVVHPTSIAITRTIGGNTDTLAVYSLEAGQLLRNPGGSLTDPYGLGSVRSNITVSDLEFSSGNGTKVWISMTLTDDMGTSGTEFDDQRVEINSVAVCRNEPY
jgi:hypothetical protein